MKIRTILIASIGFLFFTTTAKSVSLGQIDDFENGTEMGWIKGGRTINPSANITDGGPQGVGDNYLQIESGGGNGPDSRLVSFNPDQWAGNYIAADISSITADMANFGNSSLSIRIAIGGAGAPQSQDTTWYVSSNPFLLPADGEWKPVSFDLDDTHLTQVSGSDSLNDLLSNVNVLRILSASNGPDFRGESIIASLGVDNITAVPVPAALWLFVSSIFMLLASEHVRRMCILDE